MRDILLTCNRGTLERFAGARVLLAFDFDGTLAPISPLRDDVGMRARTRELLTLACSLYPCAVITGRSRADAQRRLEGIPLRYVVGNHGAESTTVDPRAAAWASRTANTLTQSLQAFPGLEVEHKQYSISVHYRRAPSTARALRLITRTVDALTDPVRVIGGKYVVNLTPADAPHKGDALHTLACQNGASHVIYAGDDETDEDVFNHRSALPLLGVRVGRHTRSAATHFVRDQGCIDAFIEALIGCRRAVNAGGSQVG